MMLSVIVSLAPSLLLGILCRTCSECRCSRNACQHVLRLALRVSLQRAYVLSMKHLALHMSLQRAAGLSLTHLSLHVSLQCGVCLYVMHLSSYVYLLRASCQYVKHSSLRVPLQCGVCLHCEVDYAHQESKKSNHALVCSCSILEQLVLCVSSSLLSKLDDGSPKSESCHSSLFRSSR